MRCGGGDRSFVRYAEETTGWQTEVSHRPVLLFHGTVYDASFPAGRSRFFLLSAVEQQQMQDHQYQQYQRHHQRQQEQQESPPPPQDNVRVSFPFVVPRVVTHATPCAVAPCTKLVPVHRPSLSQAANRAQGGNFVSTRKQQFSVTPASLKHQTCLLLLIMMTLLRFIHTTIHRPLGGSLAAGRPKA